MIAVETMTWVDFYDTAVILAVVGLAAMGIVWCWLRFRAWRDHRAMVRAVRMDPAFRKFEDEMRKFQMTVGTALVGPASRMAEQLAALEEEALERLNRKYRDQLPEGYIFTFDRPRGTVQNPSDPSPRPRRAR